MAKEIKEKIKSIGFIALLPTGDKCYWKKGNPIPSYLQITKEKCWEDKNGVVHIKKPPIKSCGEKECQTQKK